MSRLPFIASMGLSAAAMGVYLFFFLKRIAVCCHLNMPKRWLNLFIAFLASAVVLLSLNLFGISALVILHITVLGLLLDLLNLIVRMICKTVKLEPAKRWKTIYRCGLIPLLGTGIILTAGYFNMENIRRTDYSLTTDKLNTDYKIAFLSDLHYGTTMEKGKLQQICKEISEAEPDLVLLGGDLIDENTSKEQMQTAFQTLGQIQSRYGCFYVYGNHDRQPYKENKDFYPDELKAAIEGAGITILCDETRTLNSELILIGREDYGMGDARVKLQALLSDSDSRQFRLVLDHQPADIEEAHINSCDLQLSGHTHNGQIWPVGIFSALSNNLLYGIKKVENFSVIVSSGIGGWGYPIRTEGHSEWVMVELLAAE